MEKTVKMTFTERVHLSEAWDNLCTISADTAKTDELRAAAYNAAATLEQFYRKFVEFADEEV